MGFCDAQFQCLQLAAFNATSPTRGSSLTVLLSEPGETQIVFRRCRDGPLNLDVALGTATWFNEPIVKVLEGLAFAIEALQGSISLASGEPPLQVVCFTDGQDNMSTPSVENLQGLVQAIKCILGPSKNERLYQPLTKIERPEFTESGARKIPVWLFWMLIGPGAKPLQKDGPNEITVVNATVPITVACRMPQQRVGTNSKFNVGDHVWLRKPGWVLAAAAEPGIISLTSPDSLREVVIIACPSADKPGFTVLHSDEVEELNVEASRFCRSPEEAPEEAAGEPEQVRFAEAMLQEQALRLCHAASTEPGRLLKVPGDIWAGTGLDSSKGTSGAERFSQAGLAALKKSRIGEVPLDTLERATAQVGKNECMFLMPPPPGFIEGLMHAVGAASQVLVAKEHQPAQTIAHTVLMAMGPGLPVDMTNLPQHYQVEEKVCRPVLAIVRHLASIRVLKCCGGCYEVEDNAVLCLRAACRFLSPGWDAITRSHFKFRRGGPTRLLGPDATRMLVQDATRMLGRDTPQSQQRSRSLTALGWQCASGPRRSRASVATPPMTPQHRRGLRSINSASALVMSPKATVRHGLVK